MAYGFQIYLVRDNLLPKNIKERSKKNFFEHMLFVFGSLNYKCKQRSFAFFFKTRNTNAFQYNIRNKKTKKIIMDFDLKIIMAMAKGKIKAVNKNFENVLTICNEIQKLKNRKKKLVKLSTLLLRNIYCY